MPSSLHNGIIQRPKRSVLFFILYENQPKLKRMPKTGGHIAVPRLQQNQLCMKHRGVEFDFQRNIGANTDFLPFTLNMAGELCIVLSCIF